MDSYVTNSTKLSLPPHPFYPIETELVGYLANDWSVPTLLGVFAAGWAVILTITMTLIKRHNPSLPVGEKATIMWFVLCTCITPISPARKTFLTGMQLEPSTSSLKVRDPTHLASRRLGADDSGRLLCAQPHPNGWHARFFRTALEGVLALGF